MSDAIIAELAAPLEQLAGELEQVAGECAIVADDVRRAIREGSATIDALIAETEQAFERLRQAHAITRTLTHDQAVTVLRGIRAKNKRQVGFRPNTEREVSADA